MLHIATSYCLRQEANTALQPQECFQKSELPVIELGCMTLLSPFTTI